MLTDTHSRDLREGSGLSPQLIQARGYRTATTSGELVALGFSKAQAALVPALLIPMHRPDGTHAGHQLRPDAPRIIRGKPIKYETPKGGGNVLDVPPSVRSQVLNPNVTLIVTEGVKKADALAGAGAAVVALTGVWNWKGKDPGGGKGFALPAWESIPFGGRRVVVLFDSDGRTNANVRKAGEALRRYLQDRGADARLVFVPPGPDGRKQGADDYLLAGGDLAALLDAGAVAAAEPTTRTPLDHIKDAIRRDGAELWKDGAGELYATWAGQGVRRTAPLAADGHFAEWAGRSVYLATKRPPGRQTLSDAVSILRAETSEEGRTYPTAVRVHATPERLLIALGDEAGNVVSVTSQGWKVMPPNGLPARFLLPASARPLPSPEPGGRSEDLGGFLNVAPQDLPLVWGFIVAAFLPTGTMPVLAVEAESGSGKSTFARFVRRLVDPSASDSRLMPVKPEDFASLVRSNHLLVFDNLSSLTVAQSDILCKIASGTGLSARKLYTTADEMQVAARNPILLNGIGSVVSRPDLAERCIPIRLPSLLCSARRSESELEEEYAAALPLLFGVLLDRLVLALRDHRSVVVADPPRLVDMARWVAASEPLEERDRFLQAYRRALGDNRLDLLEGDAVASAVAALIDAHGEPFTMTTRELYRALTDRRKRDLEDFPKGDKAFGRHLGGVIKPIRENGYGIERARHGRGTVYRLSPPERGVGGDGTRADGD